MGQTLAVPLPIAGAAALAGVEETALVAFARRTVELPTYGPSGAGLVGGAGSGGEGGSPCGIGASSTSAMSGYRSGRGGRMLSTSKGMLRAIVRIVIQSPTVSAGSARWFVVGAWDQAGSRRRGFLGKVLEPQVVMLVVPADRAIGCGECTKAGIVAQPAASWVA